MSVRIAALTSRSVLRIAGVDAKGFLQGLISNDIEKATPGNATFAALLSAQGKIQFDFLVVGDHDGSYLLDVEAARAEELIKKLKLYRLRAKATIETAGLHAYAMIGADGGIPLPAQESVLIVDDPRTEELGKRFYSKRVLPGDSSNSPIQSDEETEFQRHRLSLGVPEGAVELGIEKLFLLEANAEELNGVDFKKGCYVGQELTSRMKHKTELKKRLVPFEVSALPDPGTVLTAGDREIGQAIGGRNSIAFALVRLDRLADTATASLKFGDVPAKLVIPAYLKNVLSAA